MEPSQSGWYWARTTDSMLRRPKWYVVEAVCYTDQTGPNVDIYTGPHRSDCGAESISWGPRIADPPPEPPNSTDQLDLPLPPFAPKVA